MKFDFFNKQWVLMPHIQPVHKFLSYSALVNLPKDLGMYIVGGTDSDNNFSRRCLFFSKYKKFFEKAPMATKRACFPAVFSMSDQSVYVIGGQDGIHDLPYCERFSVTDERWRPIASLKIKRAGSSAVVLDNLIFTFGGSNLEDGALDSIERYMVEYDRWDLIKLRLRQPLQDSICFNLGGARIMIFGGRGDTGEDAKTHNTFEIYDLTVECMGDHERRFPTGRTYLPGAYEPSMGLFHAFLGCCDDADLPSAPINVRKLMCSCRVVEATIGKHGAPEVDATALRLAEQASLVDPSQLEKASFVRTPSGLSQDGFQEKPSIASAKPPLGKRPTPGPADDFLERMSAGHGGPATPQSQTRGQRPLA